MSKYYKLEENRKKLKTKKSSEDNLKDNFEIEMASIFSHKARNKASDKKHRDNSREICLEELEGGCRTLKLAAEKMSDHASAQLFHRFELMAREKQTGTGGQEKFFAFFYNLFSHYGAEPLLPFGWIIFFFVVFGGGFYFADSCLALTTKASETTVLWLDLPIIGRQALSVPDLQQVRFNLDGLFSAFSFSLGNTIHPLSALSVENIPSESVAHRLLTRYGEGWSLATLFLAGLQSLLSIILLFMLGISVRRRFQVN